MGGENLKKQSEMTSLDSGLKSKLVLKNKPAVYAGGGSPLGARTRNSFLLTVLILLVSLFPLNAKDAIKWSWHSQDENISYYRWQLNGETEGLWTVVDSSVTSVVLPVEEDSILYVQSSYDGINWSRSGSKAYSIADSSYVADRAQKTKRSSMRFSIAPYSLALYRFYNGYNTASTRTKTKSVYGFAASVELDIPLTTNLSIYPSLCYNIVSKEHTVIPSAKLVQYFKTGVGVDFTFNITEKSSIYTGAFAGAMLHLNNKKASISPYFGARLGYDYNLDDHFSIGVLSRASFAFFTGRTEALMDSVTILIDPVSITLTYKL